MRHASLAAAFALGACTTAAVQTVAAPSEPEPAAARTDPGPPAAVVALADAEVRTAPSGKAAITLLARGNNAFLGKLTMDGGGGVPEHRDPTEEYIHILQGGGTITIDGTKHEISAGSTVFMPADALVSYENGPDPLVAIQIFAGPEPAAKYDGWTPAS